MSTDQQPQQSQQQQGKDEITAHDARRKKAAAKNAHLNDELLRQPDDERFLDGTFRDDVAIVSDTL